MTDLVANIDELSIGLRVIFAFRCLDIYMDSNHSQILIPIHDQDHQQLFPKRAILLDVAALLGACAGRMREEDREFEASGIHSETLSGKTETR